MGSTLAPTELDPTKLRLEQLRVELNAERISQGELLELQNFAAEYKISPDDTQLLEAAGVPEEELPNYREQWAQHNPQLCQIDPPATAYETPYTNPPLPPEVASAEAAVQLEFYRNALLMVIGQASIPEISGANLGATFLAIEEDDGWHGWLTPQKLPVPDDAPDSFKAQHPEGIHYGFDCNWMVKGGDWGDGEDGWDDNNAHLRGWDLWICASTLEWIKPCTATEWVLQNQCNTLCEAKARKLADGQWEVEMITTAEGLS